MVLAEIEAEWADDAGGWTVLSANFGHWNPDHRREWLCWAQTDSAVWSAHCGVEVSPHDPLGLCERHRRALLGI